MTRILSQCLGINPLADLATRKQIDTLSLELRPWGNKWGDMPHRFQPIPAGLDPPQTA